jgi:hypothetical protein
VKIGRPRVKTSLPPVAGLGKSRTLSAARLLANSSQRSTICLHTAGVWFESHVAAARGFTLVETSGAYHSPASISLAVDYAGPAGDVVEDFSDVFAKPHHVAAAGGTGARAVVLRFMRGLLTGQAARPRLTLWLVPLPYRKRSAFGGGLGDLFGLAGFQFVEPQCRSSSRSICWSNRSEERPNCIRRSLPIWKFSFSISSVRG